MTKYYEVINEQGHWVTKYLTGAELKEYVNDWLKSKESMYRVRNIKEAIRELRGLDFTVNKVNVIVYDENRETALT